jgi:hypothetical protein
MNLNLRLIGCVVQKRKQTSWRGSDREKRRGRESELKKSFKLPGRTLFSYLTMQSPAV